MIDLIFLYNYAINKNEEKEVSAYDYLTSQALIKESDQNFSLYYEGVISERIHKCVDDAHSDLTPIDVFILLINDLGFKVQDFFVMLDNFKFNEKNKLDMYFFSFANYLRIFGSFKEMRMRHNYAFFSNVKMNDSYDMDITGDENFLFRQPVKFIGDEWIRDAMYKLYRSRNVDDILIDEKVAVMASAFYLDDSLTLDVDNLPSFISTYLREVREKLDGLTDNKNVVNAINKRNKLYVDLYNSYFSRNCWSYQDNFLDGLIKIKESGEEIYRCDNKNAKMISVPESEMRRKKLGDKFNLETSEKGRFTINKGQCDEFREMILGQNESIDTIVDKLTAVSCGFVNEDKPIATLLLNGPTGVGKTQTAKSLAKIFFDDKIYCVDMTNFKHESDINMLIGSPPGYVGYEDTSQFVEYIKQNPKCVLLFDEIDKASSSCLPFMMRLLDEGKFSTAKGEIIDVSQCVIVATTNQNVNVSKNSANKNLEELSTLSGEKGAPFLKEFIGRFDNVLYYNELTTEDLRNITIQKLDKIIEDFESKSDRNIELDYGEDLVDDIINKANALVTGARALNQGIQKLFIKTISQYMVNHPNDKIEYICVEDKDHIIVNDKEITLSSKNEEVKPQTKYKENNLVYFG